MSYRRGDVVLVLYPHSDLLTAKRRPAPLVQADELGTGLRQVVVAMITSNLAHADHPSRVLLALDIAEGREAGLKMDSVVMTDNLVTALDAHIDRVVGSLADMSRVDDALRYTLGLA